MGKGDRKTKKGKINKGTFGVSRPRNTKKAVTSESKKVKTRKKSTSAKSSK